MGWPTQATEATAAWARVDRASIDSTGHVDGDTLFPTKSELVGLVRQAGVGLAKRLPARAAAAGLQGQVVAIHPSAGLAALGVVVDGPATEVAPGPQAP